MSNYKLNISKWRCGWDGKHLINALHPTENTKMCNGEGNMCCLGQFSKQKRVALKSMLGLGEPRDVAYNLAKVYDKNFVEIYKQEEFRNTQLANRLIYINDSYYSTIEEKVQDLTIVLEGAGHTLEVVGWDWLAEQRKQAGVAL